MKLFLFGQVGSGKSHIGRLLGARFGIHFHDGDDDLPACIRVAVKDHLPITDAMRDEFTDIIIARIRSLSSQHDNLCVAQALFKNAHRQKLLRAVPDVHMVWVRSTPDMIANRLARRTGHLATGYYAAIVNPGFESPTVPHRVFENCDDPSLLDRRLRELIGEIGPNQSLQPTSFSVTERAGARSAPEKAVAEH